MQRNSTLQNRPIKMPLKCSVLQYLFCLSVRRHDVSCLLCRQLNENEGEEEDEEDLEDDDNDDDDDEMSDEAADDNDSLPLDG